MVIILKPKDQRPDTLTKPALNFKTKECRHNSFTFPDNSHRKLTVDI